MLIIKHYIQIYVMQTQHSILVRLDQVNEFVMQRLVLFELWISSPNNNNITVLHDIPNQDYLKGTLHSQNIQTIVLHQVYIHTNNNTNHSVQLQIVIKFIFQTYNTLALQVIRDTNLHLAHQSTSSLPHVQSLLTRQSPNPLTPLPI